MQDSLFYQLSSSLTPMYGVGEANSIARIVVEDAFGAKNYRQFQLSNSAEKNKFNHILGELLSGKPVQYVLGEADFFGLKLQVSPAVLIPRQETEELVAAVLEAIPQFRPPVRVFDIGIGSGCIGIALKHKKPGIELWGMEKSPDALAIACSNAEKILGPGCAHFFEGDILVYQPGLGERYDIIVSNPPYIPRQEAALMPAHVLEHEPGLALFVDNEDPLIFYRVIAAFAAQVLSDNGLLYFECNEFNAPEVAALLRQFSFTGIHLQKDMSGADRIVFGKKLVNL